MKGKFAVLPLTLTALAVAAFLALSLGVVELDWATAWRAMLKSVRGQPLDAAESLAYTVFWQLRLPRLLTAAGAGAALAAAGVLAQGLFRESLASPTVLGTEAGGSLAAALVFYANLAYGHWLVLPLASLVGAWAATLLVLLVAHDRTREDLGLGGSVAGLLLAGFALNALLGALTSLLVTIAFEEPSRAGRALAFLVGGFAGKGWEHAALCAASLALGLALALPLAARLDVLSLGEGLAASLAVSPVRLRKAALVAMAVLVAGAVSVAGALPFVGLLVPHAARALVGPAHRPLLLLSALMGALLMLASDIVARWLRAPSEVPAGVLTSLLGAPFFISLLLRRRGGA